ncbi:hypothetical protein E1263_04135 [Kribbella antibiotica]|uniref:DUF3829 domain-containing protein n=1 Tax=Kribbella antibiotica TaxID=190195 RepID=A0A4R4ZTD4_9ACTN|nr:hypothetical protein [Kribbella antibiotica]TDD62351.1 hypothetical protein E1263_04135 [Kribbella antibiotica]
MRTSRTALAALAVLALAACGNNQDKAPVAGDSKSDKSPLAEYMGDGFISAGGGMMAATRSVGSGQTTEEDLAKQRKVEESIVGCMKTAGFEYIAVPPEQKQKGKFAEAFDLPKDKFAEQYGYGISTIDWSKANSEDDASNPNKKVRDALSKTAQTAYDDALNGKGAGSGTAIAIGPNGSGKPQDVGCRGKAFNEAYGDMSKNQDDFKKYDALFKDLEALNKRVNNDQRVVDATKAWSDCLADSGHTGFTKLEDARGSIQKKLDGLLGTKPEQPGKGDNANVTIGGPPSFDKVDAAKLGELRKAETELAVADQKCKAKAFDEPFKTVQYALEKEFVAQHKAELEAYRDGMANR